MEIKDQTMTTAVDENGKEYVSEIEATYTVHNADGSEASAEITTTADEETGRAESHMTVTETAADGTESVSEYVVNDEGTFKVEESSAEQAFEALTGVEIEDTLVAVDPQTGAPLDEAATEETASDETNSEYAFAAEDDPTADEETYTAIDDSADTTDFYVAETPADATLETSDLAYSTTPLDETSTDSTTATTDVYTAESDENAAELAAQEDHAEAARNAQNAADEFVASGDYAAASEARETAENEAYAAGDGSMLGAYDAQDLSNAADKQADAAYYERQEAEFAQQGDYEAAREAASNAGYATYDADTTAGGDDHTGQADKEYANMDNAVWQENIAKSDLDNAAWHAENGNLDAAQSSLDSAAEHQAIADDYGNLGEHGGTFADYDPSSDVATGGTYDSTYDTTAVDTGFDSTVDTTAATTYDTGTNDV